MRAFLQRLVVNAAAPPIDFWTWISQSVPVGAVINGAGLLSLAALFAGDRILTKGQHQRRSADQQASHDQLVAELKAYHEAILVSKDEKYADMKDSRDKWRDAADIEGKRSDALSSKLSEAVDVTKAAVHALASLEQVTKRSTK